MGFRGGRRLPTNHTNEDEWVLRVGKEIGHTRNHKKNSEVGKRNRE
jgi:hypothetical protein